MSNLHSSFNLPLVTKIDIDLIKLVEQHNILRSGSPTSACFAVTQAWLLFSPAGMPLQSLRRAAR